MLTPQNKEFTNQKKGAVYQPRTNDERKQGESQARVPAAHFSTLVYVNRAIHACPSAARISKQPWDCP